MSLKVFTGPMFGGKSRKVINSITREADLAATALLINHSNDDRSSNCDLSTHASHLFNMNITFQTIKSSTLLNIDLTGIEVVGVDEAQFFDDLVEAVLKWKEAGKSIYIAGLCTDFQGKKFGQVSDLIGHAESFKVLTADCIPCLKKAREIHGSGANVSLDLIKSRVQPAIYSVRISEEKELVVTGGSDKYVPMCYRHAREHIKFTN